MKKTGFIFLCILSISMGLGTVNAQNLLLNPGFEDWTAGVPDSWDVESGVNVVQENLIIHEGMSSLSLESTGSSNRGVFQNVPVTEGYVYEYTAYLYGASAPSNIGLYVNWLDSGGGTISGVGTFYNTLFGEWEMVTSGEITAPAGAVNARCRIRCYIDTAFGGYADETNFVEIGIANTPTPGPPTETPNPTPTGPTPTPLPVSDIKLNEVFINPPGSDIHTFVELYFPGGVSLDGYSLVGVNGNGGADYQVIDLTGFSIPGDGFFVIAQDDGVANYDLIDTNVNYQNGPDSIQLRMGPTVVDAIGYGDFTAGDVFAGEGTPAPAYFPGDSSSSRIPDGDDSDNNVIDFVCGILTSGLPNMVCPDPTSTPVMATPTDTPVSGTATPVCNNDGDIDFNGSITAGDAQIAFSIALGVYTPSFDEACAADCDGSGNITAGDAQKIFGAALGLDSCVDPM